MDLAPFKNIVKERCGLCFEEVKSAKLKEGISFRKAERGITADADYLACLQKDEDEFHCLINLLTINETYFFREPVHMDLLVNRLFPEMLSPSRPFGPVRILHAGCSTGEEPYSLMIKFLEKYGKGVRRSISITGVDIDSSALKRAKEGIYGGLSFRGFPASLQKKYFEADKNNRYRILDVVKEGVSFAELNLMSDTYPDALHNMDAIFYRNVSIYFETQTQRRIFERLARMLKDKGWLFVSSTETLSHNNWSLSLVELDNVFCYRKNAEAVATGTGKHELNRALRNMPAATNSVMGLGNPVFAAKEDRRSRPKPGTEDRTESQAQHPDMEGFEEALTLSKDKRYAEALLCIDALLERDPAFIRGHMLKSGILINMKRLEEAERACRKGLELDRWCLEGHLLLGLAAKLGNDMELALRRFREAVYIRSSCWLAHFYIAEILFAGGDGKNACREYNIVVKLLQKEDRDDHGLTFFPLAFPVEQILHLCRHHIGKLKEEKG